MAYDLSARKLISIVLFFFVSLVSPLSAKWTYITDGYLGSVYLDFKTLDENQNTITVWQLQNFSKKDVYGVKSRRLLVEFNCLASIRRVIYLSAHSEQMAQGNVKFISNKLGKWEQPLPNSLGEKVFIAACSGKKNF